MLKHNDIDRKGKIKSVHIKKSKLLVELFLCHAFTLLVRTKYIFMYEPCNMSFWQFLIQLNAHIILI